MATDKVIILDFGSQYTQLIARVVREFNVYCEIIPFHKPIEYSPGLKAVILSGSPFSVNESGAPDLDIKSIAARVPVLGICYGAQLIAKKMGGTVEKSDKREYGRAKLTIQNNHDLFLGVSAETQVWMSHSDSIKTLPAGFELLGTTDSIPVAAFKNKSTDTHPILGLQFHPEVYHSTEGKKMIYNFLTRLSGCKQDWTAAHFITEKVAELKEVLGDARVVMGLSGGVDSTVAATLIHKAIGENLFGIFVDNGVLRKNEFEDVLAIYKKLGLHVTGVNAR